MEWKDQEALGTQSTSHPQNHDPTCAILAQIGERLSGLEASSSRSVDAATARRLSAEGVAFVFAKGFPTHVTDLA